MKFAIAQYTNLPGWYTSRIDELSVELGNYFATRNYGIGLDAIYIGLITVDKEFEEFFKPKRPKYFSQKEQIDSVQKGQPSESYVNLDVSIRRVRPKRFVCIGDGEDSRAFGLLNEAF